LSNDILEQIREISGYLYNLVIKAAKGKWEPFGLEKLSEDIYLVTLTNIKKPEKIMKYKCVFLNGRWFIV
jgi:hypothetical protein